MDSGTTFVLSDGSSVHVEGMYGPEDWYASLDADELQAMVDAGHEAALKEQTARWATGRS